MVWSSSLAHLLIAGLETADAASGLATILFELLLLFCGYVMFTIPNLRKILRS